MISFENDVRERMCPSDSIKAAACQKAVSKSPSFKMNSRAEQFEDAEKNFIRKDKVCRSESRMRNHGGLVTR